MWIVLVMGALFTMTQKFVDEVILPKWFATYYILLIGGIFFPPLVISGYMNKINWSAIYSKICWGTNILIIIESLLALAQKYSVIQTKPNLIGSFDSITGLISALCLCLPMGILFFQSFSKPQKILFIICKTICCFTIIVYESRTGIICILITLLYYLFGRLEKKKYWPGFIIFIAIFVCTIFFKTSSSQGRLFIIKRSLEMVEKHPIIGWGNNGFRKNYLNFQADYFSCHPDSKYALLGGNVHHPINEYILILVDYGIPILVLVLIILLGAIAHSVRNKRPSGLEGGYILGIIIIYAMFSYPFSYPFTYVMLILALILIYSDILHLLYNKINCNYYFFITMILALLCLKPLTAEMTKQIQWKRVSTLTSETGSEDYNIISNYQKIYSLFSDDYNFLYDYACVAYNNGMYPKALILAQEAKKHIADYDIEMLVADIYHAMDDNDKALKAYWRVHNMCPSRIAPLYESYKICRFQNDTIKCLQLYAMMKEQGVKIKNVLTESMFFEIEKDIIQLRNKNSSGISDL